ncbi:hypothetical protein SAICODRAFT_5574 [Saitoella complicata NRRL Y-17804]|uniref:ZZ-type domain-containing protein n=1 Tax=Saitoella complicata (strain BCRC 22490 / CBS 7301 / JCM 7358 / NBRC 10748 / NRRL Y-17804) TaxID=698492 RepID=A0A0E9NKC8_SAICN|nr:uncharacterized protein SAICODRAFT_5574 [Saitoella complicata NRRL Y-17804]ODQ54953.1 hypothetical protein SAICODRAFT_5574 [Saitoella complicata NRRL Y-17804]GAO49855.1 hypothetical protein G7K_3992-t1 [Saitoella complicata NRRL Y-17804]
MESTVILKVSHNGTTKKFKVQEETTTKELLLPTVLSLLDTQAQNIQLYRWSRSADGYALLEDDKSYDALRRSMGAMKDKCSKLQIKLEVREIFSENVNIERVPQKAEEKSHKSEDESKAAKKKTLEHMLSSVVEKALSSQFDSIKQSVSDLNETVSGWIATQAAEAAEKSQASEYMSARSASVPLSQDSSTPTEKVSTDDYVVQVSCDVCGASVRGTHYHCPVCRDGDYDVCPSCVAAGKHCFNDQHWMVKRNFGKNDDVRSGIASGQARPPSYTSSTPQVTESIKHNAVCDGCDQAIAGVRHKCFTCPDYDLCSACQVKGVHSEHILAPLSTPGPTRTKLSHPTAVHRRVYCDGRRCPTKQSYITGIRYKCAICADTDFCASCEAHPDFLKSKCAGHPLVKFRAPVDGCDVTAYQDGVRIAGKPEPTENPKWEQRLNKAAASAEKATQKFESRKVAVPTDMKVFRHHGIICDGCDRDVVGDRWICATCPDFDLCSHCFNSKTHDRKHAFVLLKKPTKLGGRPRLGPLYTEEPSTTFAGPHLVECDICENMPKGARYRCTECVDYGLCEGCMKTGAHDLTHGLLHIPFPLTDDFAPPAAPAEDEEMSEEKVEPVEEEQSPSMSTTDTSEVRQVSEGSMNGMSVSSSLVSFEQYAAEFVEDSSLADGCEITVNVEEIKSWTLLNSGMIDWEIGTHVVFVGGDEIQCLDMGVTGRPSAGEKANAFVRFRAPAFATSILSYFSLADASGKKFGPKLWLQIKVVAPQERAGEDEFKDEEFEEEAEEVVKESSEHSSMVIFPAPQTDIETHTDFGDMTAPSEVSRTISVADMDDVAEMDEVSSLTDDKDMSEAEEMELDGEWEDYELLEGDETSDTEGCTPV